MEGIGDVHCWGRWWLVVRRVRKEEPGACKKLVRNLCGERSSSCFEDIKTKIGVRLGDGMLSASGLVVKFIVAIDEPPVQFRAGAFFLFPLGRNGIYGRSSRRSSTDSMARGSSLNDVSSTIISRRMAHEELHRCPCISLSHDYTHAAAMKESSRYPIKQ